MITIQVIILVKDAISDADFILKDACIRPFNYFFFLDYG